MASTTTAPATNLLSSNLGHLNDDFKSSFDNYLQYQRGSNLLNDRYSFIENLQTGSFGKVTAARDVQTNQKVAIKALKKSVQGVALMANHEVAMMRTLGYHKNITQLVDFFETKKYYIMVLEYADCGDLYDAIHNKTNIGLSLQNNHVAFISFLTQLMEVINYSHSKGIYHRDIKPENILLTSDGTIKLCDWGLATKYTKSTDFNVGTEKYMAPEALVKTKDLDYYHSDKVDAYSLGITLLFTLFNKCPFRKALANDPNYSNFLKSKYFIYDFFPSINSTAFTGIVDMLMISRDLNGLEYLIENGADHGFTLDQEHSIRFSNEQNNYINSIIDSFNDAKLDDNSNENDVFLFDDHDMNMNMSNMNMNMNFNNDAYNNEFVGSTQMFSHDVNHSNVNPISISSHATAQAAPASAPAQQSYATTYNPSSLFDSSSAAQDPNSFINSFELSDDMWSDQLLDLRFKMQWMN